MSSEIDKLITFGQMALEQGWYSKAADIVAELKRLAAERREEQAQNLQMRSSSALHSQGQ